MISILSKNNFLLKTFLNLFILLFTFQQVCSQQVNAFQPYNTQGDNMIHVTTADLGGIGKKSNVVGMTVEGKVIAFQRPDLIASADLDNRLWEFQPPTSMGIRLFAGEVMESSAGDEVILPGTDGNLRILSATGELLLDKAVSSGALYTATVAKGVNGQVIIATSGVDGLIYFLNSAGDQLATVKPISGKANQAAGLIRHLVAGDFDGKGTDEIMSFVNYKSFQGNCFFDITDLLTFSRPTYWNGINSANADDTTPSLGFTDKQLPYAYDMDGDGDDEVVGHWGVLHPENGPGTQVFSTMIDDDEKLALSKYKQFAKSYLIEYHGFTNSDKEDLTNTGKYLLPQGIPGDYDNDGKPELFTVYGDDLFLSEYEPSLERLDISAYTWAHSLYHFTSAARLEDPSGGADKIVLGGPITGDDHYYVVDMTNADWRTDARKINGLGNLGEIDRNLDQLSTALNGFSGKAATVADEPISFLHYFSSWLGWEMTPGKCATQAQGVYDAQQNWYDKIGGQTGYRPSRIRLVAEIASNVYGVSNDGRNPNITAAGMVEYCRALAQKGVYFSLKIGHGPHQYMTPENLADCYEASIVDGECYMMARTRELSYHSYFDVYKPHMDALLERAEAIGVDPPKVMLCAKGAMFSTWTQKQTDDFFPKYKDILVPGVENSNVNVQDWSIAERVGMWMNGDVKNWGCNVIGDNLTANRVAEWGGMRNGHVLLRQMLNAYALGATVFRLTSVTSKENPLFVRGNVSDPDLEWTQAYEKGIINFLKAAEKGLYPNSPTVEQIKSISPVSIALYNRSDRLLEQSLKHDHYLYKPASQNYVLNQFACWDAYTDVPEYDVSSYVWGAKRRWDNLFPSSPGGFVTIVPNRSATKLEENTWCNKAYQTNGDFWMNGGKNEIISDLVAQRNNLDFYIEGECVWHVAQDKDNPNTFFVFLMGNNVLSPIERSVVLKVGNNTAAAYEVFDQFDEANSLGTLYSPDDGVGLSIPKASVRFLRIELIKSLGVEELDKKRMKIYPNPASQSFQVELPRIEINDATITVYNCLGAVIERGIIENSMKQIDVSHWSSGVYFVNVRMKNEFQTMKIIIN